LFCYQLVGYNFMQARTAPTSPAAKKNNDAVTKVWADGQIQQPSKTPWGRLILTVVFVTLILNIVTVAAFGWYVHRFPKTWLARFAPLTSTTTTTVIQSTKDSVTSSAPAAVERLLSSAYGLARNQGKEGFYRQSDMVGLAWPLSTSGWTVSVTGAWPTDVKSLVISPSVGQVQAVTSTVSDPGSSFIFLKSTELKTQPISLGSADDIVIGRRVWIVSGQLAVARELAQTIRPRWESSDRDESYVSLDAPVNLPVGSAVVTDDGEVIGLLGGESRVWPLPGISSIVRQVIQQATISRPVAGLRVVDQRLVRVADEPTAIGFLIGADEGEEAVVAKGPADKAGLKAGDIITAIDSQAPTATIFSALSSYKPGDKVTITYLRQAKEKTVSLTLGSTRS